MQGGLAAEAPARKGLPETAFERRGQRFELKAPVTGAVSLDDAVAVSAGDGTVWFFRPSLPPTIVEAHNGVVLSIAADGDGVVTGGDDGRFLSISAEGDVEEITHFGTRWVDCVASSHGHRACSSGKEAHVWLAGRPKAAVFEHASTIGGLAFDDKGKRIAVAHYGGATVWQHDKRWKSSKLFWKGFHGDTCFSPNGKYLVTAMQENALHAWRLRDKGNFAMPGYPAKIKSLTWVGDTPHLVTSGADEAIAWPFDGKDGPMGRKPVCVAYNEDELVTVVQNLPGDEAVFAGFQDGSVLFAKLDDMASARVVRGSTGAEVTAIAVLPSGSDLLIGDSRGNVLWAPLRPETFSAKKD
ncbi:MAG: WD40 repeat domain-containing protein [Pseudomonadota bacterium]